MKGTITIELEGLSPQELDRCREIVDTLFVKKVLFIRNGSAKLNFDSEGVLQEIIYETRWKKNKQEVLPPVYRTLRVTTLT